MSGAAGGSRIRKEELKATIQDYRDKVLKPLNLDKSYRVTGVKSRPDKDTFGDIDIVLSFDNSNSEYKDDLKKQRAYLKQELAKYISQITSIPDIPHKDNKKYFLHGNTVSILYPIAGREGEYVQIDNIISVGEEEGKFTYGMLDLPAEKQALAAGLMKTVVNELSVKQLQSLFKELGIKDIPELGDNQEYDFNLSTTELTLLIATKRQNDGKVIWKSTKMSDVETILKTLGIDIKKDKFNEIVAKIKKFKNEKGRSLERLKGLFHRMVNIGDAEVGTKKGDDKKDFKKTIAQLEEKYNPLVMELVRPFLTEGESTKPIAIFPGKFKPPHRDHIARIEAAANDASEVIVLISPKTEPGGEPQTPKKRKELEDRLKEEQPITAEQSMKIFNAIKLPDNVTVMLSNDPKLQSPQPSPVKAAHEIFLQNPDQKYIGVFGKEEDSDRFKAKYPNVEVKNYDQAAGNLSATDVRKALKKNEDLTPFLPNGITSKQYREILGVE